MQWFASRHLPLHKSCLQTNISWSNQGISLSLNQDTTHMQCNDSLQGIYLYTNHACRQRDPDQIKAFPSHWIKTQHTCNDPLRGIYLYTNHADKEILIKSRHFSLIESGYKYMYMYMQMLNPIQGFYLYMDRATRHTKQLLVHLPFVDQARIQNSLLVSFCDPFRPIATCCLQYQVENNLLLSSFALKWSREETLNCQHYILRSFFVCVCLYFVSLTFKSNMHVNGWLVTLNITRADTLVAHS